MNDGARPVRPGAAAWLAATLLALAGCSTTVTRPPTPEVTVPPTDTVPPPPLELPPDAVPRSEPRSRYGNPASYEVFGKRYFVMADSRNFRQQGQASWYGPGFHGQRTSSGEPYDMYAMTAAHKTLPLPVYVRVENLSNGRSIVVRVNDRGPFVGDRIIDLSYSAAARLDMLRAGTAPVEISVIETADPPPQPARPDADAVLVATGQGKAAPTAEAQFVQAGAFSQFANAQRLADNLRRFGFAGVEVREGAAANGQALYRVHLGPMTDAREADDVIERLAIAGVPDARIAPLSTLQ